MTTDAAETDRALRTYTRLISTPDGGSAFEDAYLDLRPEPEHAERPAMFVGSLEAAAGTVFVRFGDFPTASHPATSPQWVVMLRGEIEVRTSDGASRRFGPGDLLLANDTTGRGHVTLLLGDGPHEALGIPAAPTD